MKCFLLLLALTAAGWAQRELRWTPEWIETRVDDQPGLQFQNPHLGWAEWPFDRPFHILLNLAVGGSWGRQKGIDDSIWPQSMEVDSVRVYDYKL